MYAGDEFSQFLFVWERFNCSFLEDNSLGNNFSLVIFFQYLNICGQRMFPTTESTVTAASNDALWGEFRVEKNGVLVLQS